MCKQNGSVSTNAKEPGMTKGYLTRISKHDIQTTGNNGINTNQAKKQIDILTLLKYDIVFHHDWNDYSHCYYDDI